MANKIINQENKIENMMTEDSQLKEKVQLLEAVVQKMFVNVIQLEAKINNKKITIKGKEIIEEDIGEETEHKSNLVKTVGEDGTNIKLNYKPPLVEVEQDKCKQNNDLKCEICDYSCKKINMLKKHMNMKHADNKCKVCDKSFPNSMDTLVHTAKEHGQKINEDNPMIIVP